ncbi:MAG TPA: PEP-CTERM sorting domain-containing protein [Thauera sp.]|nr:PEP-CTERM sorting domain-containing protein [Thauera sp.]
MKSIAIRMAVATALCAGSLGAVAATNWNLTNLPANNPLVSGWKASSGTSNNANTLNGLDIYQTTVGYWSGSGIGVGGESSSDGQHSLDNKAGFEVALLSFDQQVRLESVNADWIQTDSDIFVMAFTGSDSLTAATSLDGGTFKNLTSRGWTLVGNYADIGMAPKDLGTTTGTFANTYSSFWLIGAGAYTSGTGVSLSGDYDYLKIASVGGTIKPSNGGGGSVPEPGSLALAGLAFLGMVAMRARKQSV